MFPTWSTFVNLDMDPQLKIITRAWKFPFSFQLSKVMVSCLIAWRSFAIQIQFKIEIQHCNKVSGGRYSYHYWSWLLYLSFIKAELLYCHSVDMVSFAFWKMLWLTHTSGPGGCIGNVEAPIHLMPKHLLLSFSPNLFSDRNVPCQTHIMRCGGSALYEYNRRKLGSGI